MRLAKRIAEVGVASRREAEKWIEEGRVSVNGQAVLTPVFFVDDTDIILVDGERIVDKSNKVIVWKFYKPRGVITSRRDPQGRLTVFDLIREKIADRLLYIGRLDYNSEGLLLFTNNGDFARKMELPSSRILRTYKVRILGQITQKQIQQLQRGVTVDGIHYGPMKIQLKNMTAKTANKWLHITLAEGKNREIRKIMNSLNCKVNRLIRISYGNIKLDHLRPGEIEQVPQNQLITLLKV